jgi:hypothetical protein
LNRQRGCGGNGRNKGKYQAKCSELGGFDGFHVRQGTQIRI